MNHRASLIPAIGCGLVATAVALIALPPALLIAEVVLVLGRSALGGVPQTLALVLFLGFALTLLLVDRTRHTGSGGTAGSIVLTLSVALVAAAATLAALPFVLLMMQVAAVLARTPGGLAIGAVLVAALAVAAHLLHRGRNNNDAQPIIARLGHQQPVTRRLAG